MQSRPSLGPSGEVPRPTLSRAPFQETRVVHYPGSRPPPPSLAGHPIDPSCWDPLQALAADLKATFVEPVRARVFEALGVLKEFCGQELVVEDDLAVDAFAYALVELVSREEGAPEQQRVRLLQLLAAQIFYSARNSGISNKGFFWAFLNDLARKYQGTAGDERDDAVELASVLDEFLAYYKLNGPENSDVIAGIQRLVLPHLRDLRRTIRDGASQAGSARP